ncbi:sugar-binding protein [Planctomycetes bacterium Poly30]|uniref:sugar-binding protein n=1 Tax=Saltatorellus ferox TaxID=2528018 RepID=UPI0011A8DDEC
MRYPLLALVALAAFSFVSCGQGNKEGVRRVAVVSNCVDPFWNVCAAGARAKADELGIEVEVVFPDGSAQDQKQKLEDLRIRGVDGIAVSALDASGLNDVLNAIAAEMPLITQDSDAPGSDRVCFIGVDNYAAGRVVGKLVKEACPDGGKVAIFIGRLEQQNSRDRRQGVIDELLDRDFDSSRFDEVGSVPKGGKYEVIGTLVDNSDQSQAKASAEDTLTAHPDLACMVGLFAYNPPNCLEAARSAGKLGEVKIVGFDEDDVTLEGIEAGTIYATVSQNPYEYGSESVRVLNALCDGDKSVIPAGGVITVPSEAVRKDNVVAFRKALEERRQGDQ